MEATKGAQSKENIKGKKMDIAQKFEAEMLEHVHSLRDIEGKGDSEVEKVYEGAVVFITGGTGFLGKQLIEKLLRACPGIKRIYLLSRSKKGKDLHQRLESMLKDPVFDELRSRCPDFEKRLVPIEGDVTSQKLGITDENWKLLTEEVNIIFHAAATVRFDEPLKVAVNVNVRGTREATLLAKECKDLRCFVYVSTAYAHCNKLDTKERFYNCPVPPETMIELVDSLENSKLEAITKGIVHDWPNTYTFSKALAEEVIRTKCRGMPACIVRPAIVVGAYQEPTPGWLDMSTITGPIGLYTACAMGLIKVVNVNREVPLDYVPVDFVNNVTIAASWDTVKRHASGDEEIMIYTLSRKRKPMLWRIFIDQCQRMRDDFISPKTMWFLRTFGVQNYYLYSIAFFFLHWIPSCFIDPLLFLTGSKIRLSTVQSKVHNVHSIASFFVFNCTTHDDDNTLKLYTKMSKIDQQIFKFNVPDIDLVIFVKTWYLGMRKFILKDGLVNTEHGVRMQFWFHKIEIVVGFLYAYSVFKVLFLLFDVCGYCSRDVLSYLTGFICT